MARVRKKIAAGQVALNPPLGKAEVESFESRHGVLLPEEYRRFIMEIGNGGAGPPEYGLLRLGEVPDGYFSGPTAMRHLDRPFPLTQHWVWEDDEEEKPELRDAIEHGRLFLGDEGCAQYWILIVTGPERGQVWQRADIGIQPCAPPRDFLSWYEYWLDGGQDWWAGFKPGERDQGREWR